MSANSWWRCSLYYTVKHCQQEGIVRAFELICWKVSEFLNTYDVFKKLKGVHRSTYLEKATFLFEFLLFVYVFFLILSSPAILFMSIVFIWFPTIILTSPGL